MLPVTHNDLLIILACTLAIVVLGFIYMSYVAYRSEMLVREAKAENLRLSKALVYQEEEKTRAFLHEHGWPD